MRPTLSLASVAAIVLSGVSFDAAQAGKDDEDIWAIRCITIEGSDRFAKADNYAKALKAVRGLKDKYVVVFHDTGESSVFYGRYQRSYNSRTDAETFKPDPAKDMDLIRQLSFEAPDQATGVMRPVWPFRLATLETLPVGDSKHPEWELSNAPGYYSLQVGVFYNTEGMRRRKFAAEEYCRLLRKDGQEAYFHHGAVNSSVCIGAFPESAIQTWQETDPYTGMIRVQSKIVDKRMLELQEKYPHNTHNGRILYEVGGDRKTGKNVRSPHTSFPVEVPRENRANPTGGRNP